MKPWSHEALAWAFIILLEGDKVKEANKDLKVKEANR